MRILSVTVKNFRMHENLEVTFDRERTLVAGPNESGKSTLVDAIERVLCYPHRSTAGNLDGIKPKAGGGPPEVMLKFERGGRTYMIHKIFRGASSVATLADDAGNHHTGDEAEEQLRALLGLGDTPLKNVFRGWTHLWARQGDAGNDPTDKDALGAAAKDLDTRLKRLTGAALTESERDTAAYDRIAAEYDATFKQRDAARVGSPLGIAIAELESAREAATQAAARLAEYETAADTVVREEALIAEERSTRADAESRLTELRTKLVRIEDLEQTLETQRTDADRVVADHTALQAGDAQIENLTNDINTRAKTLEPLDQEIERLKVHERRCETVVANCLAAIEKSNELQRTVATAEDLLKAIARVFELQATRTRLAEVLEQIKVHRVAIAAIDARLRELPEVDKATIEYLEDLDRKVEVGRGKLEASSARIEVLVAAAAISVDGRPLAAGESKILTNVADVTIGEGTRLQVMPGGGASLLELRAEVARLAEELARKLGDFGLPNVAQARTVLDKRLSEEASRRRLEEKINDLDGDAVQGKLDEVVAEIERTEAEITRKQPDRFERPANGEAIGAKVRELEQSRREADAAASGARTDFDTATRELTQIRGTREGLENELTTERREVRELELQRAVLERSHGMDRDARLQTLADDRDAKLQAVAETEQSLGGLNAAMVRGDKDRLDRVVTVCTEQINQAEIRKAKSEGQLVNAGTIDLHAAKAAADARLDIARRRHAEVHQRAQAVRRLRDLFDKQRQTVAEMVAAPLRTKVAEYLDQLYGTGSRIAVTKTGETFEQLAVTRQSAGNQPFRFDELSGGTREQVAAACRLAMAEVLAGGGGADDEPGSTCLPMVFDDAFGNSDPDRINAVHRVLDLGVRRGLQVIVLSCAPKDYGHFGAKRVDLPPPRLSEASFTAGAAANPPAEYRDSADSVDDAGENVDSDAAGGSVPSGDDAKLRDDFLAALAALPERKSGNKSLREQQLGWDQATYERIKEQLIAGGRIQTGRGRGGSVQLVDDGRSPA